MVYFLAVEQWNISTPSAQSGRCMGVCPTSLHVFCGIWQNPSRSPVCSASMGNQIPSYGLWAPCVSAVSLVIIDWEPLMDGWLDGWVPKYPKWTHVCTERFHTERLGIRSRIFLLQCNIENSIGKYQTF